MGDADFDELANVYDAMIDWPRRLASEGAFLRRWFEQANVQRVADVACGTGRHAAMFHEWGLQVVASDLSADMIARARATFGEPAGLRWVVQGFEHPPGAAGSFDAVICLGNSLALAADAASAAKALRGMLGAVRSGGLVIIHLLNLWKIAEGPSLWQKVVRASVRERDSLILKSIHRCGDAGFIELVVVPLGDEAAFRTRSMRILGFRTAELETIVRPFSADVQFFGNAQAAPYDCARSTDIIMVATRGG